MISPVGISFVPVSPFAPVFESGIRPTADCRTRHLAETTHTHGRRPDGIETVRTRGRSRQQLQENAIQPNNRDGADALTVDVQYA